MLKLLDNLFAKDKIEYYGAISISDCKIINEELFNRKTPFVKSVICFLVPYYSGKKEERNISLYAISRDYHIYINELTNRIISELRKYYPNEEFTGMGDHSPINEVNAASKAGLGVIGDNNCLINKKYGSFVFIGEIFTSMKLDTCAAELNFCTHCGKCKDACPSKENCLSELTQRKGELTKDTIDLIRAQNTAWGCDVCQTVCPLNKHAEPTPIDFFYKDRIPYLTMQELDSMNDEELKSRAFGWRKRKTIERNIKALIQ